MARDLYRRRTAIRPLALAVTPLAVAQVLLTIGALWSIWRSRELTLLEVIGVSTCVALTTAVVLTLWLAYRHTTRTEWLLGFVAASSGLATVQAWYLTSTLPLLAPLLVLIAPAAILRRRATTIMVLVSSGTLGVGLLASSTPAAMMLPMTLVGGLLALTSVLVGHVLWQAYDHAAAAQARADLADTRLARFERQQRFWRLQQRALRHDLRPPCTIVVQIVEQLQTTGSTQQYPALLQELKLQALRLRTRIDQLVEDARSKASPEPDLVALDLVVCELAPDLRGLVAAHRHAGQEPVTQVTVNAPPAVRVLSHRETVIRMMENLVANSARAGAQSIWITVTQGAHEVRLIVQDDGPGYPDEMLVAPMVEMTVARRGTNGLGLPWIAAAIAQYGGRIELDNWHAAGDSGAQTTLVFVAAETVTDGFRPASVWTIPMSSRETVTPS